MCGIQRTTDGIIPSTAGGTMLRHIGTIRGTIREQTPAIRHDMQHAIQESAVRVGWIDPIDRLLAVHPTGVLEPLSPLAAALLRLPK